MQFVVHTQFLENYGAHSEATCEDCQQAPECNPNENSPYSNCQYESNGFWYMDGDCTQECGCDTSLPNTPCYELMEWRNYCDSYCTGCMDYDFANCGQPGCAPECSDEYGNFDTTYCGAIMFHRLK
mgnify:CR=1 FL=1